MHYDKFKIHHHISTTLAPTDSAHNFNSPTQQCHRLKFRPHRIDLNPTIRTKQPKQSNSLANASPRCGSSGRKRAKESHTDRKPTRINKAPQQKNGGNRGERAARKEPDGGALGGKQLPEAMAEPAGTARGRCLRGRRRRCEARTRRGKPG